MNKVNYQKILDKTIEGFKEKNIVPTLLLHSCCAPCSSYVLEYLSSYFHITIFFYNPNISSKKEYKRRAEEQERLISSLRARYPITFIQGEYDPEPFYEVAKGLEDSPEGGDRCFRCYELRLARAASYAGNNNFHYFTTTLSISPHKDAAKLNEIGSKLSKEYNVPYLYSDFKKKDGYKRSIELSKEYDLYRQDYCGCAFSMSKNATGEDIIK